MSRTQTMVQLSEHLVELLDDRAARAGVSRSHVIREALEAYLAADRQTAIDRQVVEGYERVPQGGEYDADEWGNVGNLMTALTAQQLQALNQEERDAGFEPW